MGMQNLKALELSLCQILAPLKENHDRTQVKVMVKQFLVMRKG